MLNRIRVLGQRIHGLFSHRRLDEEFQQEIDTHLEMLTEENLRRGLAPEEARRTARVQLGGITQLREIHREMWSLPWLETLLQDLRYGLRQLRRNPGFTAVAVLTLALGIGANTAIFSIFDDAMLRPLPYPAADRLVGLNEIKLDEPSLRWGVSADTFMDWKKRSQSFEEMALINWDMPAILEAPNGAQLVWGNYVSDGYFQIFGAKASLGRLFLPDEYAQDAKPIVILSTGAWRRIFNSDPNIIGKEVKFDGKFRTIVGVLSPDFHTLRRGDDPDFWGPVTQWSHNRKGRNFHVVGRLKKGTDIQTAQAEMDVIARQIAMDDQDAAGFGVFLTPIQEWVHGRFVKSRLLPLFGAVLFILLIACANMANLMLARATARDKEFAIRCAVGGGRARLIRQLLTESTLLAVLGGSLGALLAYTGVRLMGQLGPDFIPHANEIAINLRVLAFTFLVALVTGLLFGLLPALVASKPNLNESLKETGRRVTPGIAGRGAHGVLVVAEVALALILLIGAGLMIHNVWRLLRVDVGFNPKSLITMTINLPGLSCCVDTPKGRALKPWALQARKQIRERLQALPGIRTVSITNHAPLWGCSSRIVGIGGQPPPAFGVVKTQNVTQACFQPVSPDYFRTLQVPLLKGREFTEQDNQASPRVALVNEAFARRYFPSQDPLGKVIRLGYWDNPTEDPPRQVVGVVGDYRQILFYEAMPALYVPYSQLRPQFNGAQTPERTNIVYVAGTSVDPTSLYPAIRRIESKVAPDVPIVDLHTIDKFRDDTLQMSGENFYAGLLLVFAFIAVVLTVVGVFGVTSYSVGRRTHEIGIRMALGAQKRDVLRMVVGQGLKLALIGTGLGIAGAFALTRYLKSLLYGARTTDPLTFIAVSLILIAVALLACYIPARRAANVDPMVALRFE